MCIDIIGLGCNIFMAVCGTGVRWVRNVCRGYGTTLHKCIRIFVAPHPFLEWVPHSLPHLWPFARCAPPPSPHVWADVHEEIQVSDEGDDAKVCATRCTKKASRSKSNDCHLLLW